MNYLTDLPDVFDFPVHENRLLFKVNLSIKLDAQPDSMQMESMYKRSNLYLFKDRNDASNLAGGSAICGSIKEYQYFTPTAITVLPEAGSAFNSSTINDNATAMMAIRQTALTAKK